MAKESICRNCFHSYVCEQFNEHKDENNEKCHFFNDHYTPTADVVEVVRCKDCVYYIEMKGFDYKGKKARSCVWHSTLMSENAYCSDGIRRRETDGRE